jgi:hypothetical protein
MTLHQTTISHSTLSARGILFLCVLFIVMRGRDNLCIALWWAIIATFLIIIFPTFSWNPKVYDCVQNNCINSKLILSDLVSLTAILIISSHVPLCLPLRHSDQNCHDFLTFPHLLHAPQILLHFIIQMY